MTDPIDDEAEEDVRNDPVPEDDPSVEHEPAEED